MNGCPSELTPFRVIEPVMVTMRPSKSGCRPLGVSGKMSEWVRGFGFGSGERVESASATERQMVCSIATSRLRPVM